MKPPTIYLSLLVLSLTFFSGINSQYHGPVEGLNLRIGKRYFPFSITLDERYQHERLLNEYRKSRTSLRKILIQVIQDMDST